METTTAEIIACAFVLLLGFVALGLIGYAIYLAQHVHGPGFEGLGVAIYGGAGAVLSGLGSLCAYIAKKEKKSGLQTVWGVARWLNYGMFITVVAYAAWLVIQAKLEGKA